MISTENSILLADAYKYSHPKLYKPETTFMQSYYESRGGKYRAAAFFGLQYILKHFYEGQIFNKYDIDEAEQAIADIHGRKDVFDRTIWERLLNKYGGAFPVEIKAVPEGSIIPTGNVLITNSSTDRNFAWLPDFMETLMSHVWYPITINTQERRMRQIITNYFIETASEAAMGMIDLYLNDFGFRSSTTAMSAGVGGMAHLLNFYGGDNNLAAIYARRYYNAKKYYGGSVPATQHSIACGFEESGELDMYRQGLDAYPTGAFASILDTYNIVRAATEYIAGELKGKIMARDGVFVGRLDSGDAPFTIMKILDIWSEKFGHSINQKGFKMMPTQVRLLQSDGIDEQTIRGIYGTMKIHGYSSENVLLGQGTKMLQDVNRDIQQWAFKGCFAIINDKGVELQKRPMEFDKDGNYHHSFKVSKPGDKKLVKTNGGYVTCTKNDFLELENELKTVFYNGELIKEFSFEEIRQQMQESKFDLT